MAQTQYVYGQPWSLRRLSDLLEEAATRQIRWAHFGDSQETSPGGNGTEFMNRLSFELLTRFTNGVTSESRIQNVASETGHWLGRAGRQSEGPSTALTTAEILPNFGDLREIGRVISIDGSGFIHVLDYNATNADADADTPIRAYIDNTATFNYEVFVVQSPGAPDLAYRFHGRASESPGYFVGSTVQTIKGTDGPAGTIAKITIPDVSIDDPATTPWLNMITGSATTTRIPIIGGRFISQTDVGGITIQPFGEGGAMASWLLDNHGSAGPMFAAFGPYDIIGFQYGTNDVYGGDKTATEIMADIEANIDAVRSWAGNDPLVVLISEAPRIKGTTAQDTQADALQVALREYADANWGIVMLDARAVVEQLPTPWTREAEEPLTTGAGTIEDPYVFTNNIYLNDVVHYKPAGAIAYAQAVAQCLERVYSAWPKYLRKRIGIR